MPSVAVHCDSVRDGQLPPRGLEEFQFSSQISRVASNGGANYGAHLKEVVEIDPFLATLIEAAPNLSENEKKAVLVLVKTFISSRSSCARLEAPHANQSRRQCNQAHKHEIDGSTIERVAPRAAIHERKDDADLPKSSRTVREPIPDRP